MGPLDPAIAPAGSYNLYPAKYRLPGDVTPDTDPEHPRETLYGARAAIVHSLTYYGMPYDVDQKIEVLFKDYSLDSYDPLQENYLSFTVYSLKQMVGAGTISPETAWTLLNSELGRISEVTEENFHGMHEAFIQGVRQINNGPSKLSLQQFEFWARAGEAGLAQYTRFEAWGKDLVFDPASCKGMSEAVREQYREALWLEMRTIEGQIGIAGLNQDIELFRLSTSSGYNSLENSIAGVIDLFDNRSNLGRGIDVALKSEIGHWMFDALDPEYNWVSEVMDRMNSAGYTSRVNSAFSALPDEALPPEARLFRNGGYYLTSRFVDRFDEAASYPLFPAEYPTDRPTRTRTRDIAFDSMYRNGNEGNNRAAEKFERQLRIIVQKAVETGKIKPQDALKTYRQLGTYVALLNLEGFSEKEITDKVNTLDLKEIGTYYINARKTAIAIMEKRLKTGNSSEKGIAARALIRLKGLKENSPQYNALIAYVYITSNRWKDIPALGKAAIPALEAVMAEKKCTLIRMTNAAKALCMIKDPKKGTPEYKRLQAYILVRQGDWDGVRSLGKDAIPALQCAIAEGNPLDKLKYEVKGKAASLLMQIENPPENTESFWKLFYELPKEEQRTNTQQREAKLKQQIGIENDAQMDLSFLEFENWEGRVRPYGTAAIPALECALFHPSAKVRGQAAKLIIEIEKTPPDSPRYRLGLYPHLLLSEKRVGAAGHLVNFRKYAYPTLELGIKDADIAVKRIAADAIIGLCHMNNGTAFSVELSRLLKMVEACDDEQIKWKLEDYQKSFAKHRRAYDLD